MVAALAGACGSDRPTSPGLDAGVQTFEPWVIPLVPNRDLDLLFVVDNSGSMAGEQLSLANNFPAMMNTLATILGGLPDVHIGVISSNVGAAGQASVPGCSGQGDDGNLLVRPHCTALTEQFISDVADGSGGRVRNYTGGLGDAFGCIAQLGTGGCGFEMHLESMYRALQPGKNPGFRRPGAHLAVVIIADEDDCSTEVGTLFGDPTAGISSPLGPRTSFRCHEFGVRCDNDPDPRAFGTRNGCRPDPASAYLFELDRYVGFLQSLEYDPSLVMVAGIVGEEDELHTVVVGPDPQTPTHPTVEKSCFLVDPNDPNDGAAPPIRLGAFLRSFPGRFAQTSICNADLSQPLAGIGALIKRAIRDPCVRQPLRDADPARAGLQAACTVDLVTDRHGPKPTVTRLPACDAAGDGEACWRLAANPAECPDVPGNLAMTADHAGPVTVDSALEARCELE